MAKTAKKKRRKYGGRKKGTPNKATSKAAKRAADIASSGLTPLEYLLSLMRSRRNPRTVRMEAAKYAAPYVHPKLQAITHTGDDGGPIQFQQVIRVIRRA